MTTRVRGLGAALLTGQLLGGGLVAGCGPAPSTPAVSTVAIRAELPAGKVAFLPARHRGAALGLTASDGSGLRLGALQARAVVAGPLAFTELRLSFDNPADRTLEGTFHITLPQGATVSRLSMRQGDKWQEGEVVETQAARQAYEDALHRRQDPALLEQAAGNEFSARVFPIPARGRKELIISYSQRLERGGEAYRMPLGGLPDVEQIEGEVYDGDGHLLGAFRHEQWKPEGDFAVGLPAAGREGLRSGELVVARVTPFASAAPDLPGASVFLVDTSASRTLGFDAQLRTLDELVQRLGRHAGAATPVSVIAFDQRPEVLYEGPASGLGPGPLARLRTRGALGASNLGAALTLAGDRARAGSYKRVVVIGDGVATAGPTEAAALRGQAASLRAAGVERLDAVAVGGIRDDALLKRLTTAGLPRDGAVIESDQDPDLLWERLAQRTQSSLAVRVNEASWWYPRSVNGIQPGDEVLVFAEVPPGQKVQIQVGDRTITPALADTPRPLVERAVAAARIDSLLSSDTTDDTTRQRVIDLSTHYRVMSPYTSLLVLETDQDYERFHIDRRALSEILTVQQGRLSLAGRTQLPADPLWPTKTPDTVAGKEATKDAPRPAPRAAPDANQAPVDAPRQGESADGRSPGGPATTDADQRPAPGGGAPPASPPAVAAGAPPTPSPEPPDEARRPSQAPPSLEAPAPAPAATATAAPTTPAAKPAKRKADAARLEDERMAPPPPPPPPPPLGAASGEGGLGLSGIGTGGGGTGEGIGLGNVGTLGHGAGSGTGQGFGNGHGRLGGNHRSAAPQVRMGATQVNGRLPPQVITRIVRQSFGRFRLCYENGLRNNPNLQGRVAVRFVIDRSGAVSSAGNGGSDLPDPAVISCVVRSFKGLQFPQPESGIVSVTYPIMFSPGDGGGGGAPMPPPGPPPPERPQAATPYSGRFKTVMDALDQSPSAGVSAAMAWHTEEPGDILGLLALGEVRGRQGDFLEAGRAYGSLIDLFPARADMRRYAANRLEALGPESLPLAVDSLRQARDQRPDHPASHRMLAMAQLRLGLHAEAFATLADGLARTYPSNRFLGHERILSEDLGLVVAAWIKAEPARRAELEARLKEANGHLENEPSLRFVLTWETDANDVDFHIFDDQGHHAFFRQKQLEGGGELYADVTTGYGPECFTVRRPAAGRPVYTLQAHYYSRGPMGYGMGKLEVIDHDGKGGMTFEERPFVVMEDRAFIDLGRYPKK